MARDLARLALHVAERHDAKAWPSLRWAADPVGFMRTYLAFEPWDRQREIAELVRDNPRVAIASGHRIGKTDLLGAIAIWFYCCYRDARAILIGPTTEQIDGAAYRSVQKLLQRSGRCVECAKADPDGPKPCPHSALITGEVHTSSHHGVKSTNDLREIRGVNVRSEEAAQGIAGENIIILGDEASGEYLDKIMGALAGNRAGGAKFALFGNPIRSVGEFADAFGVKADFYATRRISSEESPNVKKGRIVIPGLATSDWVEEQLAEYGGRDSPFFKMRVLGQHVSIAEGAIFQAELVEAAVMRWKALRDPATGQHYKSPSGPLVVALDPAGESGTGDDSVFMARRGYDVLELYTRRGLSPDAHVAEVVGLIGRHRHPGEIVPVVQDAAGDVGARVRGAFIAYQTANEESWKVFNVKFVQGGHKAERDPTRYMQVRDEQCAACVTWLQDGGSIPDVPRLKIELSRYAWLRHVSDKAKATPKDGPGGLREQLGRSPGHSDVLMLATWVRGDDSAAVPPPAPAPPTTPAQALQQLQQGNVQPGAGPPRAGGWDPYAALRDFYGGPRR
jgi:phage terminase large subunit